MNLSKLGKQLRREITANPKKAAILGLLAAVALWFWVPLVWGWMVPDEAAVQTEAALPAAEAPAAFSAGAAAQPDGTPEPAEVPRHAWQQLVQWMENDPRTRSATFSGKDRDPFVTPESQIAKQQAKLEPQEREEVQPDLTPESLGVVLSSTIIGPRRRVARIDGVLYESGETVKLDKGGGQIEFLLAEIHPRRIILSRDGKRFELSIPTKIHSGRIEPYEPTN